MTELRVKIVPVVENLLKNLDAVYRQPIRVISAEDDLMVFEIPGEDLIPAAEIVLDNNPNVIRYWIAAPDICAACGIPLFPNDAIRADGEVRHVVCPQA